MSDARHLAVWVSQKTKELRRSATRRIGADAQTPHRTNSADGQYWIALGCHGRWSQTRDQYQAAGYQLLLPERASRARLTKPRA